MTGARRLARPVRLKLAQPLGGDIDGAWWPRSGSVAGELPELIEALHRPLGEITELQVNWSATEPALDFDSVLNKSRVKSVAPQRRHRLMLITGRTARATLLVIPPMTTPALGAMVMRCATGLSAEESGRDTQWSATAVRLVGDAQVECVQWMRDMAALATTKRG